MANDKAKVRKKGGLGPILRGFKPAVPATVGSFALTFLFAVMMPMPWISAICWHLYLDTIHPIFAPPLGNAARVGVALGFAILAALIALVIALAMVKPAVKGNQAMNRRVAARAKQAAGESDDDSGTSDGQLVRRRRLDAHPDAPMVAPLNAARDLPAGGLGPALSSGEGMDADYGMGDDAPLDLGDELLLGEEAEPLELGSDAMIAEPMQPNAGPFAPAHDPTDSSLGAMVARFEQALGRRLRQAGGAASAAGSAVGPAPTDNLAQRPANEDEGPVVDLALEAALATLQRMSRTSVG